MYRVRFAAVFALVFCFASPCLSQDSTASKLQEWKRGVWLSSGGGYAVWTDNHYFVVWGSGEGDKAQVYCGSSRVRYTDKGIARQQNLRIRKTPRIMGDPPAMPGRHSEFDMYGIEMGYSPT